MLGLISPPRFCNGALDSVTELKLSIRKSLVKLEWGGNTPRASNFLRERGGRFQIPVLCVFVRSSVRTAAGAAGAPNFRKKLIFRTLGSKVEISLKCYFCDFYAKCMILPKIVIFVILEVKRLKKRQCLQAFAQRARKYYFMQKVCFGVKIDIFAKSAVFT